MRPVRRHPCPTLVEKKGKVDARWTDIMSSDTSSPLVTSYPLPVIERTVFPADRMLHMEWKCLSWRLQTVAREMKRTVIIEPPVTRQPIS